MVCSGHCIQATCMSRVLMYRHTHALLGLCGDKLPAYVHTFSPNLDCLGLWFLLLGNIVPGQSFLLSHCRNLEDRTNLLFCWLFILKMGGRWISCLPTGQLNRWSCLGHVVWVPGQLSILQQRVDLALVIHRPHVCLRFTPLSGCRDHFN